MLFFYFDFGSQVCVAIFITTANLVASQWGSNCCDTGWEGWRGCPGLILRLPLGSKRSFSSSANVATCFLFGNVSDFTKVCDSHPQRN